ncbi:MAG: Fe-S cluster assembly protein SufD [Alphaproteobacteria bacterium]|jgi:Fe-S cluster assembly protein SufD|nr:Fe-S cluster assembly protein SufD [Alphaproteobacteria bacterium]
MTLAALIEQSRTQKEAWHYTNLLPYAAMSFVRPSGPRLDCRTLPEPVGLHRLVFVDGQLARDLSDLGAIPDALLSVNEGDCLNGLSYVLSLGGQACLAIDPIELLFVNTSTPAANEQTTKLKIALGENSRLTLIERHMAMGNATTARHIIMEMDLAAQSKLVHGEIIYGTEESLHFSQANINVAAGAFYDHFNLIVGGRVARCEKDVLLSGPMADAQMSAVMLLRDGCLGDVTNRVRHLVPHTSSQQTCKAVLDDKAKGVFQGKVVVNEGAQKTDAYQSCRALLLSQSAEMNAKPELEIYADDVKCSHGAAIGDLDETALFYLQSRGLSKESARAMLIEAFVAEKAEKIQSEDLRRLVLEEVETWLR